MNAEQVIFEGLSIFQVDLRLDLLLEALSAQGLKRSIHSTSQNRIITYYFGNEEARDEAVRRWRKQGIEIIGYQEKPIMLLQDAINETVDYFEARITALQLEFRDNNERYRERPPEWAIKRQRELELEIKRLQDIVVVFRADIDAKVEAQNLKAAS